MILKKKEKVDFDAKLEQQTWDDDVSLIHYTGAIPTWIFYMIVTKGIMWLIMTGLTKLISLLMNNLGIGAVTNTDLPYLLTCWQGIVIFILGLLIIILYTVFDINCMILLSDNVLHQRNKKLITIMKESIETVKYLAHPKAIILFVYITLLAPLTMSIYGITLTESFYIPDFITSVIEANAYMRIPYYAALILITVIAFFYLFTFHFMVLRKENISVAMHTSRVCVWKDKWNFIKRYGFFLIKSLLIVLAIAIVMVGIPFLLLYFGFNGNIPRFWLCFFLWHTILWYYLVKALFTPFQFMELNRIYESYTTENEGQMMYPKHSLHIRFWLVGIVVYACIIGIGFGSSLDEMFDYIYPIKTPSKVIAHRAGGTLANENTILGLEASIEKGVYAGEIDIQRTKDGHYIVNHDDNLLRLTGVNKKSYELTLDECKQLKIKNTFDSTKPDTEMATIEEMLDCSKGRIHLYVELKGETADWQMAEDLYQMIKERDMIDEVTVISLKYDLISKLETTYPEVSTGYLCYISLGNIGQLKCDQLLLEDELASYDVIEEAHDNNKEVYIWTVDTATSIKYRMLDDSDGIITDEVTLADDMYDQLEKRSDFNRVLDFFLYQVL